MLSGIAWDHQRCWGPLDASVEPYAREAGVTVRWDRRSLYSFGEGDLEEFVDKYDLVIFDHPHVGEISAKGMLIDIGGLLSDDDRSAFERDAVGRSWSAYCYDGGVWALPIDTAAQTAAFRPDLMDRYGFQLPVEIEQVIDLGRKTKARGVAVGWPIKPTDLMCTLLSIAASLGLDPGHDPRGSFLEAGDLKAIIEQLKRLAAVVHPGSRQWNPIRCLDLMRDTDEIVYAPYLFNYVNYGTANGRPPIRFCAPPQAKPELRPRALLGGAGIGISARSRNPEAALAYAKYLCSPPVQSGFYVSNGGQPGSRAAWTSALCNEMTNGFFADTLQTMETAYLRPRHSGFVPFFRDATLELAKVVHDGADAGQFATWLNETYERVRCRVSFAEPSFGGAL